MFKNFLGLCHVKILLEDIFIQIFKEREKVHVGMFVHLFSANFLRSHKPYAIMR
jgi:hypothetical protein